MKDRPKDRLSDRPKGRAQPASAWDGVRRVREPVAWTLLLVTAVVVLVSAWQLFGLPHSGIPAPPRPQVAPVNGSGPGVPGPAPAVTFAWRAAQVAGHFVAGGVVVLPVLAVLLVALTGGLVVRDRRVVQTAVSIQAVTLGLGLVCWAAAFGVHLRAGVWFIYDATDLVALAAALAFTVAVLRSSALRPATPR